MNRALITSANPTVPFSPAVRWGNMLFVSGATGTDPKTGKLAGGGVESEAKQAMENLMNVLEKAGGSPDSVLKTTIFLANMDDFAVINEIYKEYFKDGFPARSCFQVGKLPGGALFEIECIAGC